MMKLMKLFLFFALVALVAADRRATKKVDNHFAGKVNLMEGSDATELTPCEGTVNTFWRECACECFPNGGRRSSEKHDICHNGQDLSINVNALQAHCVLDGEDTHSTTGHAADSYGSCASAGTNEYECRNGEEECNGIGSDAENECGSFCHGRGNCGCSHAVRQGGRGGSRRLLEDDEDVYTIYLVMYSTTDEPISMEDLEEVNALSFFDTLELVASEQGNEVDLDTSSSDSSDDTTAIIVALVAVIVVCSVVLVATFWKYNIVCFASKSNPVNPSLVPSSEASSNEPTPSGVGFDFLGGQDDHYTIKPFHLQQTS